MDTRVAYPLNLRLFNNPLTNKYTREMDSPVFLPGIRGLKITLVAGLALLTTDALFAQSTDQSSVNSLKDQMTQMQKQYEQRIEAMEAKMKALESNANNGSILNTRVLTDADGKAAAAPSPMLDESFLKSLTRNFTFSVYIRSGVGFNGNGGPQDFSFQIPDFGLGRFRLGNENDTYMELTWKQAHLLGDSRRSPTTQPRLRSATSSYRERNGRYGKRISRQRTSSSVHRGYRLGRPTIL